MGTAFFKWVTQNIPEENLMIFAQKGFFGRIFRIHYILYIKYVVSVLDANLILANSHYNTSNLK